jgi:hypothetical protein
MSLAMPALSSDTGAKDGGAELPKAKPKGAAPAKQTPPVALKTSLVNAKQAFRTAVQLCDTPGRCEQGSRSVNTEYLTMLKDTEKAFVEACERCSTPDKCEVERQRIRDGKTSFGSNPCK